MLLHRGDKLCALQRGPEVSRAAGATFHFQQSPCFVCSKFGTTINFFVVPLLQRLLLYFANFFLFIHDIPSLLNNQSAFCAALLGTRDIKAHNRNTMQAQ